MADHHVTLKDLFSVPSHDSPDGAPGVTVLSSALASQVKGPKIEATLMRDALASGLDSVLSVEVSDIVAGAWLKTQMLRDYRDKSLAHPAETMTVALATHTIESKHSPSIDVLVNNKKIESLSIEIHVKMVIESLSLTIQNGRVKALRPGTGTLDGRISCKDITLVEHKAKPLAWPGAWSFGEGLVIPGAASISGELDSK